MKCYDPKSRGAPHAGQRNEASGAHFVRVAPSRFHARRCKEARLTEVVSGISVERLTLRRVACNPIRAAPSGSISPL